VRRLYSGSAIPGNLLLRRGKVRDIYRAGPGRLLIVASDRISAFDAVLAPGIPDKGVILTQLSNFWFETLADAHASHLISGPLGDLPEPFSNHAELAGRASLVRELRILPVECVVRGYIAGSGWKEYQATGTVCGIPLPAGLRQADQLSTPIFTPSTKATVGHDENISFDAVVELVGAEIAEQLRTASLELYRRAAAHARARGIIIADTKLEFGLDESGGVIWADEAFTPDSSRFWPASGHVPGRNPPSFDKQFVRDWLERSGWDKRPPAPALPDDVVESTRALYLEGYRRLTGRSLAL
jgi:phosphoribosylaminoimidazole-succinocarboxamide synthase